MNGQQFDHMVKILLIGESGVGKTCILQRFNKGEFLVNHLTTIAIDFKVKFYEVNGVKLKMQIWDTAGQERFHTLTSGFFKSAHGIVIVYSITDQQSFERVTHWMDQIKDLAPGDVKIILTGNKSDLDSDRVVDEEQGRLIADKYGIPFFESSAYSGDNVGKVFEKLGGMILENFEREEGGRIGSGLSTGGRGGKKNCC